MFLGVCLTRFTVFYCRRSQTFLGIFTPEIGENDPIRLIFIKWLETCWNHQLVFLKFILKKVHHFWCEYVVTFLFSDCSFSIELLFFFNGLPVLRPMMVFCFLVGKAPRYLPRLHYALLVLKFCYDWLNVLSSDVALFFVWKALTKALQSVGSNFGPGFKDLFVDFFTPPKKKH